MEIMTKYDIRDMVWLIDKNKAVKKMVTSLGITITGPDNYEVIYGLDYTLNDVPENRVYKTKKELLESL